MIAHPQFAGMKRGDVLARERSALSMRLPAWSVRKLDAEGVVNEKTWREMPGSNGMRKACNWWLWKRGLLVLEAERAEEAAMADFDTGGEV